VIATKVDKDQLVRCLGRDQIVIDLINLASGGLVQERPRPTRGFAGKQRRLANNNLRGTLGNEGEDYRSGSGRLGHGWTDFADRTVFQTREWLHFVRETQRAKIVLCELADGGETVGYFTGLLFSRFGVPDSWEFRFPGWTTPYMGFNLIPGASRKAALAAIELTAWDTLKCLHMEVF